MLTNSELNVLLRQDFNELNASYSRAMSEYIRDGYLLVHRGAGVEKISGEQAIEILNELVCALYTKVKLAELFTKR